MFQRILVPLDGSPYAERALPVAAALAQTAHATVNLALVHEPAPAMPLGELAIADLPAIDGTQDRRRREFEQAYIEDQAKALTDATGIATTTMLLDGDVTDALADYAREHAIDLVVMTTHGRGGIARMWLGSTADTFVRRTHTPVLLVRPHEDTPERRPTTPITNVVIPLDGSQLAEQIVEHALKLGSPDQVEYTLLQVVEPLKIPGYAPLAYTSDTLQQVTEGMRTEAHHYLESIARRLRAQGYTVTSKSVIDPIPARAIIEYANNHNVDVIAMATHGRGGLARLLVGSVADKVMRGADTLVLLDHPEPEKTKSMQKESEVRSNEVTLSH